MNRRQTTGKATRNLSRGVLLGAAAGAMLVALPAGAATLFTASASGGSFTLSEPIGHGFSFGYYGVQIHGACFACVAASAPDGSSLGTFGFSTVSGPFGYITNPSGTTQSALPAGGGQYSEHFEGYGTFDITPTTNGPVLLGGASNYFGVTVFAAPGSSTAIFEFDLDQYATSDLVSLPSKPLYLDVTGTTAAPVTLGALEDGNPPILAFNAPLTVDFDVKLTDTPYSPVAGPSGAPEPKTWAMMMLGLAAVGTVIRSRRRRTLVLTT
jgi:hypothetical protein